MNFQIFDTFETQNISGLGKCRYIIKNLQSINNQEVAKCSIVLIHLLIEKPCLKNLHLFQVHERAHLTKICQIFYCLSMS